MQQVLQRAVCRAARQTQSLAKLRVLTAASPYSVSLLYAQNIQLFRYLSVPTKANLNKYSKYISNDFIISSHEPDINIPEETFHDFIFRSCDRYKDNIALVSVPVLVFKVYTVNV